MGERLSDNGEHAEPTEVTNMVARLAIHDPANKVVIERERRMLEWETEDAIAAGDTHRAEQAIQDINDLRI